MRKLFGTELPLTSSFELYEITPCKKENYGAIQGEFMPDLIITTNWMIIFVKPFKWLTVSVSHFFNGLTLCFPNKATKHRGFSGNLSGSGESTGVIVSVLNRPCPLISCLLETPNESGFS